MASIGRKWEMPFDWNLSRINAVNIFVHEEFKIPKNFSQFSNTTSFNATANGQPVSGRSLAIDPFSSDRALIIHYLLTKNDIIKLANIEDISVKNSANGNEIIKKDNLIALNGTGTQKITFPGGGSYQIEINVKSLKYAGQTTPDSSRNGIARGLVVIPSQ